MKFSISVFDRWGKTMFKSTNPLDYWTGVNEEGAECPDGVYYYVIQASCDNKTFNKTGYVQLIRKN
jgi:hypothetical protein